MTWHLITEPIGTRWVSCSRQYGRAGSYSIRPASNGGVATMMRLPSNWPAVVVAGTLPPVTEILLTGAPSLTVAAPSRSASLSAISAEPPANRSCCEQPVLRRPGILPAHLNALAAADVPADDATAHPVPGLQHQDRPARRHQLPRGGQPGQARTNHQHLGRPLHERLFRRAGQPPPGARGPQPALSGGPRDSQGTGTCYGLTAKLRVVQPALVELPPGADSIEVPHTWPVVPVVGAAGSGLAPA